MFHVHMIVEVLLTAGFKRTQKAGQYIGSATFGLLVALQCVVVFVMFVAEIASEHLIPGRSDCHGVGAGRTWKYK